MKQVIYSTKSTREVAGFLDSIAPKFSEGMSATQVLDAARDAVKNDPTVSIPKTLDALLGKCGEKDESRVLDAVHQGIAVYNREHGSLPTADVVEAAIQQAYGAIHPTDGAGNVQYDTVSASASSTHSENGSLQPNRAVVAILTAIAEAIPFVSYLPFDIGSNQAKLAILSHMAGSAYGDYALNGLMDGVAAGDVYASSSRMVRFDHSGAVPYNSRFTTVNLAADPGYCDKDGATGVPVLRGRTVVYVNGIPVGVDSMTGSSANSPISCTATVGGTDHVIAGYVTVATGAIQLTTVTPDFAAGTEVTAQAFVDYETSPGLIPSVIVRADTYDVFANPWRVMTGISIDAQGQIKNELGLDANSEALMAIRTQMAMERHYQALRMAWNIGVNNQVDYDFDYGNQIVQKTRSQIWLDFQSEIATADQNMANATMDHGITHLYVPAWIAAQLGSLPADLFKPSGIAARPSIYRVGRLFDKYEVYYSPKVVSAATNLATASILAVGRSSQVARCPIVLGDAVAPTFIPLGTQSNLIQASALYARDFTVTNPHAPSALGCARINVTNLK